MTDFLVASYREWHRQPLESHFGSASLGSWALISSPEELSIETLRELAPRYIFFLHWSWIVPEEIINNYECVCFHMTDVPYGRGGSPLQNLIVTGHRRTKLTALRMVKEVDAGPVYFKEDLCIEGGAEEIYMRAGALAIGMIERILREHPTPVPQVGKPTIFKRRTPKESEIPRLGALRSLHDFIRMLDSDGYPPAFILNKGFRYEFKRAALYHGRIVADVVISLHEEDRE